MAARIIAVDTSRYVAVQGDPPRNTVKMWSFGDDMGRPILHTRGTFLQAKADAIAEARARGGIHIVRLLPDDC